MRDAGQPPLLASSRPYPERAPCREPDGSGVTRWGATRSSSRSRSATTLLADAARPDARDPLRRGRRAVVRRAARAHEADADARRRGDVRRLPRRDGRRVADARSSTRCSRRTRSRSACILARRRDVRRRRARRPHRRVAAGEDRRAGAGGEPARRCSASRCSTSACRSICSTPTSSCSSPDLAPLVTVLSVVVIDERDQPHRRARRARRRHRRRSPAARCSSSPTGCSRPGFLDGSQHRPARRDHRGRRVRRASCRSTSTRRRSSWATPARCSSGCCSRSPTITIGGRTDYPFTRQHVLLLRAAADPARDPRRADRRHRVLVPAARAVAAALVGRRRGHLHHRLMRLGHGPRRTVVILWVWTALLSGSRCCPRTRTRATRSCRSAAALPRARPVRLVPPRRPVGAGGGRAGAAPDRPAKVGRLHRGRRRPGGARAENGREQWAAAVSPLPAGNRFVDPLRFDSLQGVA